MTLILSCITRDYAIQVSDRLFSYFDPRTGHIIKREDDKNKCVLLRDIMSFAYAGFGKLGGKRTDSWLSEVIFSATECKSLRDIIEFISNKATDIFKHMNISSENKRHAFVGIGWTRYSSGEALSPISVVISNYHTDDGKLLNQGRDSFNIIVSPKFMRSDVQLLSVIGQHPITEDERQYFTNLNHNLKRCVKKNVSPKIIMALLVITIRKVASKYNTVGKNLLGVCLPMSSVMRDHLPGIPGSKIMVLGPPCEGVGTFLYFPYDKDDGIQYGPVSVSPGGVILGEAKFRPLRIEEEVQNSIKIWDAFKMIVLSEVIGSGSWTDSRRSAIGDDYPLTGYQNLIGQNWPKDEPCPYYGSLFGINAEPEIISKIQHDPNYVIILQDKTLLDEIPGDNWLESLADWCEYRGMTQDGKKELISNMSGLNREEIIEKLIQFLKIMKIAN